MSTAARSLGRVAAPSAEEAGPRDLRSRIAFVAAALAWLLFALALASFDAADPPSHAVAFPNDPVHNLCGQVGAVVAYWIFELLGPGAWLLVVATGAHLALGAVGRAPGHPVTRLVGVLLMAIALSTLHRLHLPGTGLLPGSDAGLLPAVIESELAPRFSVVGSTLLLLAAFAAGLLVAAESLVLAAPRLAVAGARRGRALPALGRDAFARLVARPIPGLGRPPAPVADDDGIEDEEEFDYDEFYGDEEEDEDEEYEEDDEEDEEEDDDEEDEEDEEDDDEEYEDDEEEEYDDEEYEDDEEEEYDEEEDEDFEDEEPVDGDLESAPAERPRLTREQLREKIAQLPVRMAGRTAAPARDEDIPRETDPELGEYTFPTLELLGDPEPSFGEKMEQEVRRQAEQLEEALQTYGIDAEVVGIDSGPAVTLFSVQLAPGTKVSKVSAISSDIARSLRAQNIRIVPNMVGKTAIGIEVPNLKREKVRLKELMSGGHAEGMVLPMFLGKDASGEPLVADLTRMPHMLIAGTTGSGKSVCMNSILMSWLYVKRPDELKLVLVDPKMVELSQFADIPHLACPVVTESGKAAAILEWAVDRMEERYELLREARVQNIAAYNRLSEEDLYEAFDAQSDEERARVPKKLQYMVFVVDELADLMMTNKEVEHSIVRIAQKARAVGIHLVLATQRPQANVVTGLIKSNMPCRISFKVASGMDSRIVLDAKGAELLLGQGDMMFLTPSTSELRRAQGTLVEDSEIRAVTKFLKQVAAPTFERSLMRIRSAAAQAEDADAAPGPRERDPLFDRAVEVMIESGRGSVSLLQRRLAIGYGRASRLVDQMSRAGIIGDHKGSVAREVLITLEEWREMKRMEAEVEAEGTVFEGVAAEAVED